MNIELTDELLDELANDYQKFRSLMINGFKVGEENIMTFDEYVESRLRIDTFLLKRGGINVKN